MIIHRLDVSHFGIIGAPPHQSFSLIFPEEGRIAILGQNESGKTTLLEAIECALYGLKRGSTAATRRENLITWGKNEARLEIEFTSGLQRYILQRIIGVKSGHTAKLIPIVEGVKDSSNVITSIREIERQIEQITGMDRDSFTKLVFIKQKDLDALKDLVKSRREQLVNKVMGIEIFDTASENVKDDAKKTRETLENANIRLESISKNKQQYETKLNQKNNLESAIVNLKQDLNKKKIELNKKIDVLKKCEWLNASTSANEVCTSLKNQCIQINQVIQEIKDLGKGVETHKATLTKYKPKMEQLESEKKIFVDLDGRVREARNSLESLNAKVKTALEKTELPEKDLDLLLQNLPAKKQNKLTGFGLTLIAGITLIIIGLITNVLLSVIGFALLPASLFIFRDYQRMDKLQTLGSEVVSLKKLQNEETEKMEEITLQFKQLTQETEFNSTEEVEQAYLSTLNEFETETEQRSIQGLEAIINNDTERLEKLMDSKPDQTAKELEQQIKNKEEQIKILEKNKPPSIDELQYNKQLHEVTKNQVDALQHEYNTIDKAIQNMLGTIKPLNIDLETLKPDYDVYPQLAKEVKKYQSTVDILQMLLSELAETSKELRNKVIPHARFIINQILPTLTDGRYSDFEITEDLKFKVHSMAAGGYKEREIFSGGTQDQFLIALRLAFTQSILDSRVMADKYSLLMDECTSSSDESRKQGIFEVLDIMKRTFPQIFIIAHEDISNFVDHHVVLSRNQHGYTEIRSRSW